MTNGSQLTVTQAVSNRRAMYRVNDMHFPVTILDARKVFGRVDALITPIGGQNEKWVAADQLTITD